MVQIASTVGPNAVNLPDGFPPVVAVASADELQRLAMEGYEGWERYMARIRGA